MTEYPVLTVIQPYASAIIAGIKQVENRRYAPPRWVCGRLILIHAGRSRHYLSDPIVMRNLQVLWPDAPMEYPRGVVLGAVRLISHATLTESTDDPWACGPICWHLKDARPIEPFALRGMPGIFTVRRLRLRYLTGDIECSSSPGSKGKKS